MKLMPIKSNCLMTVILGLAFCMRSFAADDGVERPNVVFFYADDLVILAINLVRVGMARLAQLQWPACLVVIKPLDFDFEAVLDALFLLVLIFHLDF